MEEPSSQINVKRLKTADLSDFTDEKEVEVLATRQAYIKPHRMRLNRRLKEFYTLPRGGEHVIVNQFNRRIKKGMQYLPDHKSDVFYFHLRGELSTDLATLGRNTDILKRLDCLELKRQQFFFLDLLKRNTVLVDKLIRWKFFAFRDGKTAVRDRKQHFRLNVLFAHFIKRRQELNGVILKINDRIAQIILRAENSKYYLKKAVRLVQNMN